MKPNSTGVFENDAGESHRKVVRALHAKHYSVDRIAKAVGLTETEVVKMLKEMKLA
mgnify:CR=1 FL=1